VPIKEIARRLGVAWKTVRAALASDRPPRHERARRGLVADTYEPCVRASLAEWPKSGIGASLFVGAHGYSGTRIMYPADLSSATSVRSFDVSQRW
jgi:hypothetical protein